MYKKIILPTLVFVLLSGLCAAQNNGLSSAADEVAVKVANKMKDSLQLTGQQRNQLYDVNVLLQQQSQAAMQQYRGSDSLGYYIQHIENSRDSLYKPILPPEKYSLYLQRKGKLVSIN